MTCSTPCSKTSGKPAGESASSVAKSACRRLPRGSAARSARGPLGQGLLTGRVRKNQHNDLRRAGVLQHLTDDRRLDVVEQLVPLAEEAGLPMTHLAMAFTIVHPGVTSALLGARTMDQLDGLPAGLDVALTDDVLDRIDQIVPPGTDVGTLGQAYQPRPWRTRACAAGP
jgi:aryl-alcohol dehydrogenase-like predicted oxidoreductase